MQIIDTLRIEELLQQGSPPDAGCVKEVLERASLARGLSLEDAAILLRAQGGEVHELIKQSAFHVKEKIFGTRIVLFAPLYLTSYCTNGCLYCGFRSANKSTQRKALTPDEAVREAASLEEKGFKRVLLVLGEDPRWGAQYIVECVKAIYARTGMRIIHVNAAPMEIAELKTLKEAGVGLYQSFQETYHRDTYERVHPWGEKKDYDKRLGVMDGALEAGFNDVGIGALFGLYDFRYEALASIAHSKHLFERFATNAHTISIPRLRPASGSVMGASAWDVTDNDMERIVSVYRLSVPGAGVVVTTRESIELRARLIDAGASQLSAMSSTEPGGYSAKTADKLEQFSTNDHRSLEEVMASIAKSGNMPSLCTSCYRVGRVGKSFTVKSSAGEMDKFCEANAILTMKEFLVDKKANGNEAVFEGAIERALSDMKEGGLKQEVLKKIVELEAGKKDLFF